MSAFAMLGRSFIVAVLGSLIASTSALAATFVYVSNADDGDISTYRMQDSGELQPGARVKAAGVVMPMAVSPDRRFLAAAGMTMTEMQSMTPRQGKSCAAGANTGRDISHSQRTAGIC